MRALLGHDDLFAAHSCSHHSLLGHVFIILSLLSFDFHAAIELMVHVIALKV